MKRILYVDGSNLYGGMCDVLALGQFIEPMSLLQAIRQDIAFDEVHFYATYLAVYTSQLPVVQRRILAQAAFFNAAKGINSLQFHAGHLSGSGKEKGIDMRMGLDMYIGARNGDYEEAIIMTGDADFTYAAEKITQLGKKVHLAAFASRFPAELAYRTRRRYVYDFNGYFSRNILSRLRDVPRGLNVRDITLVVEVQTV